MRRRRELNHACGAVFIRALAEQSIAVLAHATPPLQCRGRLSHRSPQGGWNCQVLGKQPPRPEHPPSLVSSDVNRSGRPPVERAPAPRTGFCAHLARPRRGWLHGPVRILLRFAPRPIGSATLTFRVHGDLDLDGVVGSADLAYLLSIWGVTNPPLGDLNNDGVVGASDLSIFLGNWGPY